MDPIKIIRDKAKKHLKKIILPEGEDERVLEAGFRLARDRIAEILFFGNDAEEVKKKLRNLGKYDTKMIDVINPQAPEFFNTLADKFYEKRKHKNPDKDYCKKILTDNHVFLAAMMASAGLAEGFVAGASHKTKDVARAAIQCLELDESVGVASGSFIIHIKDSKYGDKGLFLFADCGLVPDPTPRQLAGISISTARLYETLFDKKPYVAMLSYSTRGSAEGLLVDKVRKALEEAKKLDPSLAVDGELQVDSALDPLVARKKTSIKDSPVAGKANVLIFPNLDSGNIGYKLVQRLAGARAVGPLIQGLKKPCSDLSRGCSVNDIIDAVAVTAVRAQG